MEYRNLGRSGLRIAKMSLGCNAFGVRADAATSIALVHAALDAGINSFDTADTYGKGTSETYLGQALRDRRSQAVVTTKVFMEMGPGPNDRGSSRQHILDGLDASLRRLQMDYVDVYLLHFFDPETPLEESLRALEDLVRWGKVRYVGCSNFAAWQMVKALGLQQRHGYLPFTCCQPEYSPADRRIERELLPAARSEGVGVVTYFPLAGGLFTGKYRPDTPPPPGSRAVTQPRFITSRLTEANYVLAEQLTAIAAEAGVSLPHLVLAWNMQRPGITSAIVGATRVEQLLANVPAGEIELPAAVVAAIDAVSADRA